MTRAAHLRVDFGRLAVVTSFTCCGREEYDGRIDNADLELLKYFVPTYALSGVVVMVFGEEFWSSWSCRSAFGF